MPKSTPVPLINDSRFRVGVLSCTPSPQQLIWQALHQDYSHLSVLDSAPPPEPEAGATAVKALLAGGRGHYGPLEHPQITFAVAGFPHSVMQQARTHRVGVSFDVQSFRYTSRLVLDASHGATDLEDVVYLRPLGRYGSRSGGSYEYEEDDRVRDWTAAHQAVRYYRRCIEERGFSEEHARGLLPFDYRQNFVVSFNLRSAMHFLDLRAKADAQLEIQTLCQLMYPYVEDWAPEIMAWYRKARLCKATLAP